MHSDRRHLVSPYRCERLHRECSNRFSRRNSPMIPATPRDRTFVIYCRTRARARARFLCRLCDDFKTFTNLASINVGYSGEIHLFEVQRSMKLLTSAALVLACRYPNADRSFSEKSALQSAEMSNMRPFCSPGNIISGLIYSVLLGADRINKRSVKMSLGSKGNQSYCPYLRGRVREKGSERLFRFSCRK